MKSYPDGIDLSKTLCGGFLADLGGLRVWPARRPTAGVAMSQDAGLCARCRSGRWVESQRGSQFLLCGRAKEDDRFPKYPKLPVAYCVGYEPSDHRTSSGPNIEPAF